MKDSPADTDLRRLFEIQRSFSDKFFDASSLSDDDREEKTREFALALHSEVSGLVSGINFKGHTEKVDISRSRILYEGVDVIRYAIAIMNVWGVTPEQFCQAFDDKEKFLSLRQMQVTHPWDGQDVIIVDIDDVVANFRMSYIKWLSTKYGIDVPYDSKEYYSTKELKSIGLSPNSTFEAFIEDRQLRSVDVDLVSVDVINRLQAAGYWIHMLTARPEDNLICKYDTLHWLTQSGLKFDRLSFASEKFVWASKSEYYKQNRIVAAIDDSEKHAMEYSRHGIRVFSPRKPYNSGIASVTDGSIIMYDDPNEILSCLCPNISGS